MNKFFKSLVWSSIFFVALFINALKANAATSTPILNWAPNGEVKTSVSTGTVTYIGGTLQLLGGTLMALQ
jgi:hypothetical protein